MNKVLLFTLAFAMGAGTGFLASNHFLNKKYEDILQDEIDGIKERVTEKAYADGRKELGEYAKLADEYKDESMIVMPNGESITMPDEDVANAFIEAMEEAMDADEEESIRLQTYAISEDDFQKTELLFEKITVNYYNGDATFVDENDDIETDVEGILGVDTVSSLFQDGVEQAFVRNVTLGVDYEILWNDCSYEEWLNKVRGKNG